jgi:hypothetical protein
MGHTIEVRALDAIIMSFFTTLRDMVPLIRNISIIEYPYALTAGA